MVLYDTTCFANAGFFDLFHCMNVQSSGVLYNVLLVTLCLITSAIFIGSGRSIKNLLLLSTMITTFVSLFVLIAAGASGYTAAIIATYYGAPTFTWFCLFAATAVWHWLSEL